jgi:hypothetical protein
MAFRNYVPLAPLGALLLGAALLLSSGTARADAIDGDWCQNDGRNLIIRGPQIVTPGGTRMTGSYTRHAFNYTVPAGEAGAGATVSMVLIDDDTVHLNPGGEAAGAVEVWQRCSLKMS